VKSTLWTALFFLAANIGNAETTTMPLTFDIKAAEWFANLALACGAQGIPESHQSHVEQRCGCAASAKTDSRFLRVLRLAFLGARTLAPHSLGQDVSGRAVCSGVSREALRQSLTADNIAQEAAYLRGEGRASFERPYGLAWLLQLVAELREWDDPQAKEMAANLRPLEEVVLDRLNNWLPKLSNPVRIGEHDQTAFALGLMLDYAHGNRDQKFAELVVSKAKQFYLSDKNCPLEYEPSGEDFLSPCIGEADLMRRVLLSQEFARWLRTFLPQISAARTGAWLQPVVSPDPSDPKLAHLDGLNLSRAWMLEGIAASLPKDDKRLPTIMAAAEEHKSAGLAAVTGTHYEGGHWLGSFAVYLATRRGISR
jgi:hypothetical protein